jgi:hypothetical protein
LDKLLLSGLEVHLVEADEALRRFAGGPREGEVALRDLGASPTPGVLDEELHRDRAGAVRDLRVTVNPETLNFV